MGLRLINLYIYYTTLQSADGTWLRLYFINENMQLQERVDVLDLTRFRVSFACEPTFSLCHDDTENRIRVKGDGQECPSHTCVWARLVILWHSSTQPPRSLWEAWLALASG